MNVQKNISTKILIPSVLGLYLLIYFFVSLSFLTDFPFVHSDESWLAGLTRNMMEQKQLSVTETFFDLYPRNPHAIKILFHILQMPFIHLAGYQVFSVRLLSLAAGLLCLLILYLLLVKLTNNRAYAFAGMILMSVDIQFIYASHFARQEILILLLLLLCVYLLIHTRNKQGCTHALLPGCLTGLAIGFHPNSFFIFCACMFCYGEQILIEKRQKKKELFLYLGITAVVAMIFIAISFSFNRNFVQDYHGYGVREFDLDVSLLEKISGIGIFLKKLFEQTGGTYYLPNIRLQLILFSCALLSLIVYYVVIGKEIKKEFHEFTFFLSLFLGTAFGMMLIGRYNQTSILFLFLFGWIFVFLWLKTWQIAARWTAISLIFTGLIFFSYSEISDYVKEAGYHDYLLPISEYAKPDAKVIANLNMDFYFENNALRDYRNLPYAEGHLKDYIRQNDIEYIFYALELNYFYEHRPYYNVIYGNIMFAAELLAYCENECRYLGEFSHPIYASRIQELNGQQIYNTIQVYQVMPDP